MGRTACRVSSNPSCLTRLSCLPDLRSVDPFYATSDPTHDLPRNRSDDGGHLAGVNVLDIAGWQFL
jgi:hypothetical protein